jgi:hypothetical protein
MTDGEYKYIENADGTFTEWYKGKATDPIMGDTYSQSAMEESNLLYQEIAVDEGTTGQGGSIVIGSDGSSIYAAERVVDAERTGVPYTGINEAEIGDDLIDQGISDGTLPDIVTLVGESSGAVLGVGAAITGIGIGDGISELLGWPSLTELLGSYLETTHTFEGFYNPLWEAHWSSEIRLGILQKCEYNDGEGRVRDFDGDEVCEYPEIADKYHWEYEYPSEGDKYEGGGGEWIGNGGGLSEYTNPARRSTWGTFGILVPDECPSGGWFVCEVIHSVNTPGAGGEAEFNIYSPLSNLVSYAGYPAAGLKAHGTELTPTPHSVATLPEISPIAPPTVKPVEKEGKKELEEIPGPTRTKIDELGKEEEGKPVVLPSEVGEPIPEPSLPEVPTPETNELYTHYLPRVETQGFTNIHENVLPESDLDPSVGPGSVASVSPSAGSRIAPSTHITVDVNPDDAPNPESHVPVSGPTLPGLHPPSLHLLCTTMPFGVPCWLVLQIKAFAGTSEAPVWHIGAISFGPYTIPGTDVHLSSLEPIMEIVRPFMILFSTVGLLLFFYSVFTGSKIGGGENPSGEVPEPYFSEEHATDEPQVDSSVHSDEYYKGFR